MTLRRRGVHHHNELLIREGLASRNRDKLLLSVKFGALRAPAQGWNRLGAVAKEIGASVAQVAIAWVAAQGDDFVPLIGARRRDQLRESLGALDLELTAEQLTRLASAVPAGAVAGERYAAAQIAHLDSEKG